MSFSLARPGSESPKGLSKTCQNCFALKIRCDRTQRQDICDRCARLGKSCLFRPARRRDNSARRDSRIHALEKQVQDLLRLQNSAPHTQQNLSDNSSIASIPNAIHDQDGDVIDQGIISIEKAETLLQVYRTDLMPHFPFVIIPPTITTADLRHTKPFLFLGIVSVTCFHELETQGQLCHRFKYMVSEKVLLGGDDCLQLEYLQGLLIVLAWNQYHGRSKYYSQYLQLAISIAVDMRLDRKPVHAKLANAGSKRDPTADTVGNEARGPEEQRALAGTFYISSTISRLLDKMNTFSCTQYIEEACLDLRQKAEYQTDKDLYNVIRLQQIIESIDRSSTCLRSDEDARSTYLRIRAELEEFRVYLVSNVSESHLLFMQFHTAKLFLYQVAYFERNLQHSPELNLEILCEGLEGAKSFLDVYLWLPPKAEMALTNSEWIQLSFGVTLAAKFAIISKEPHVEAQTRELRHRLNIDHVFRHLALRIGSLVGRADDGNKQKDIFFYYEQRVRKIENWYERMSQATGADKSTTQALGTRITTHNQPYSSSSRASKPAAISSPDLPFHVPISAPFIDQRPQGYSPPQPQPAQNFIPSQPVPLPDPPSTQTSYQNPVAAVGMTPISSYQSFSNSVPSIAFPDLVHANGWNNMFAIPMEHEGLVLDVSQGYGLGMASPPSEDSASSWSSPGV